MSVKLEMFAMLPGIDPLKLFLLSILVERKEYNMNRSHITLSFLEYLGHITLFVRREL